MGNEQHDVNRAGRQDWRLLFGVWAILTAIGELLALGIDLLPGKYAREAEVVDEAYVLLIALAVPVFALVSASLIVSFTQFRVKVDGIPTADGPGLKDNSKLMRGWLGVTAGLALLITVNPGFIGLSALRGSKKADIVVKVEAQRWNWRFTYGNGTEATDELVLPVDKRVRFDLTSADIIHSFWIPAFRVKLDNVPGRTTKVYITPDRIGTADDEPALRLQCAELCGLGHARMAVPVRVVEKQEFDSYLAELKKVADEEAALLAELEGETADATGTTETTVSTNEGN